ncbi:putative maltose permease [Durotheca rogersii]|uniref:putative maltose permease n=1 Tax=Durotheca rogersii TaxID=419775 RepID=UPI00221FEE33|nr:putative maltose permease [Durotheca rogersii]KAI5861516.1 putative maltose permease [Durotheca rogersii]
MSPSSDEPHQALGWKDHWKAMIAMAVVSLGAFQYGIDFGIIGGLQAMVPFLQVFGVEDPSTPLGYNIPPDRQQLIASLMVLGAFISSSSAGFTAKWVGRKLSLWIAAVAVFASTALMQTSTDIGGLYAGRVIIGLANGLLMTHSQLYVANAFKPPFSRADRASIVDIYLDFHYYKADTVVKHIQESLPSRYRGLGISFVTYCTSFGSLIGTIVDNFGAKLPDRRAYVIPLGIVHIVPGLMSIGLFFVPESPRWLAARGDLVKAATALRWLRPAAWPVDRELADMQAALDAEASLGSGLGYASLFKTPVDRRRTIIAVSALTSQAASGAIFILSYGTYFFEMAHVGNAFENTCILVGVGAAALLATSLLITKFGRRRRMMIAGFALCGAAQLAIAIVYTVRPNAQSSGRALVGLSVVYLFAYNSLIAPYAWLCGGELSSQRLRSHTFGLATGLGFFSAWLTTFTAPYFINPDSLNWGPKYGYIWTGACFVTAFWVYFYLPEVKDRSLEEIDEMFEARVPARKFAKYRCTGAHVSGEKPLPEDVDEEADGGAEKGAKE